MTKRQNFRQYVHDFITPDGERRYAVGYWDERRGQYQAPLDRTTAKLTGCSGKFSQLPGGMDTYDNRTQALRRARYLFNDPCFNL